MNVRPAQVEDVPTIQKLIQPFVDSKLLLPRSESEIELLIKTGFSAVSEGKVVGFAAVEVYSKKLAEIQCLAVDQSYHGSGVGKELVAKCVEYAEQQNVLELMAISASDEFLKKCGFDYSLPHQKRALFYRPQN